MKRRKTSKHNIQQLDSNASLTDSKKHQLENDKQELISLRENRMKGVLLRSRARWIAEGEKITKYFAALKSGTMSVS